MNKEDKEPKENIKNNENENVNINKPQEQKETPQPFKIETREHYTDFLAREFVSRPEIYTAIHDFHKNEVKSFEETQKRLTEQAKQMDEMREQLAKETEAKEKAMALTYETLKKMPIDIINEPDKPESFNLDKVVKQTLSNIEGSVGNEWGW